MNVADLELCKELYELSGWECGRLYHYYTNPELPGIRDTQELKPVAEVDYNIQDVYYYDLGYLLRKLPKGSYVSASLKFYTASTGNYKSGYQGFSILEHGDTPENAACSLAISLFKEGIE
jgi:hypothetical protein